jgi:hypothetical protein
LNPLSAENFVDTAGHLTFFPDFAMDRVLFLDTLRDPLNRDLRARLIAATLDQLRPDDALLFVRFHEILDDWPSVEGQLASSRALWSWIVYTALRDLPGLCRAAPLLPRGFPSSLGIGAGGAAGTRRLSGKEFFEERLACELAQLWREPKASAVAGIRYLRGRGACIDSALRRAPEFAPSFSPLELAYEIAHLGSWAELKTSQRTVVALRRFAEGLALRLLELCLEEAIVLPGGETSSARPPA